MLTLITLGTPVVALRGHPVRLKGKPLALLCWLALRGERISRAEVLELLWPGESSQNLRQALYSLRKLPNSELWLEHGETLGVQANTDLRELRNKLERGERDDVLVRLAHTFLEGMETMPDPFLEWLEVERHKLGLLRRTLLFERALELEGTGDGAGAILRLETLLKLDPLHESAVRELMRLEAARGQRGAALAHFEALRENLHREMGAAPLRETLELAQTLRGQTLRAETGALEGSNTDLPLLYALHLLGEADPQLLGAVLERDPLTVAQQLGTLEQSGQMQAGRPHSQIVLQPHPTLEKLLSSKIAAALEKRAFDGDFERSAEYHLKADQLPRAAQAFLNASSAPHEQGLLSEAARLAYRSLWAGAAGLERVQALSRIFDQAITTRDQAVFRAVNAELEPLAFALQHDATYFLLHHQQAVEVWLAGQGERALEHVSEALSVARRLGDFEKSARVLTTQGGIHYSRGEMDAAKKVLLEALSRETPPKVRLRALTNLAAVLGAQRDLNAALEHLEEALTLARAHAPGSTVAAILLNLATTASHSGNRGRAEDGYREAALLYRSLGQGALEVLALSNLATLHLDLGRVGEAWNTALEALELDGEGSTSALIRVVLGTISRRCGRKVQAREYFEAALEDANKLQNTRHALNVEVNLVLQDRLERRPEEDIPNLLERLNAAGLNELARSFQGELALLTRSAAEWDALEDPPDEPLYILAQTRAYLKGWNSSPPGLEALEWVRTEAPVEMPYALSLQAHLLERQGEFEAAQKLRTQALELRRTQSEGLPKNLRSSFLAWDGTSLEWVMEAVSFES